MIYGFKSSSSVTNDFIFTLKTRISEMLEDDLVGIYVHGSLAMGGFNPKSSDIDLLVVAKKPVSVEAKRKLAEFFLLQSNSPFPIEITFLNTEQLDAWQHPCPFDFHYSELWRDRYATDLSNGTDTYLNAGIHTDPDLAAHITVTAKRGVCIYGTSFDEVFPIVPSSDYISSIMGDFTDCLDEIIKNPVYCTLNLIRVYWYLKEGVISSKQEAGCWGLSAFPAELKNTVAKAVACYSDDKDNDCFEKEELILFKNYISNKVKKLIDN